MIQNIVQKNRAITPSFKINSQILLKAIQKAAGALKKYPTLSKQS